MELEARQDIAVRWELQWEEGVDRRDLEHRGFLGVEVGWPLSTAWMAGSLSFLQEKLEIEKRPRREIPRLL